MNSPDTVNGGPIDRKPRANAFFDAHVGWMPINDGLEEIPG